MIPLRSGVGVVVLGVQYRIVQPPRLSVQRSPGLVLWRAVGYWDLFVLGELPEKKGNR